MNHQIYIPYFISNGTIMEFEKLEANVKLSLMDIINAFFDSRKQNSKFYFKVLDIEDDEESDSDFSLNNEGEGFDKQKNLRI